MDPPTERRRPHDYMEALEEEARKIMVFQRELPLCLELVTQAIESCRQQMTRDEYSSVPVLEEFMFIPLKPSSSAEEESDHGDDSSNAVPKLDWLRSVQLWSHDPTSWDAVVLRKPVAVNAKRLGGAFRPFEKEKMFAPPPRPLASSTADTGDLSGDSAGKKEKDGRCQSHRKERRCWSPELHRRFLHTLQQLGGSHAATPKQIRELMKVDSLTNDEVKSHLQKYRLHTRRLTPTAPLSSSGGGSPQSPQFVLVGGIWVPPPEYAASAVAAIQPSEGLCAPQPGIYAQVGSPAEKFRSHDNKSNSLPTRTLHSRARCSRDDSSLDGAAESASPTSSSSRTTTASPLSP